MNVDSSKNMSEAYTSEEELFVDFFEEAMRFIGSGDFHGTVCFDDYSCKMLNTALRSMRYYPPMVPVYEDKKLLVKKQWAHDIVYDMLPTVMRSMAYYYAYGFYHYNNTGDKIEPYPHNMDAVHFAYGLCLLNGVPVSNPIIDNNQVCSLLKKFTGRDYIIKAGMSADGNSLPILTLSDKENERIKRRLEYFAEVSMKRKLDIRFGTEDHPFENIDEAIKYIQFLEEEAVNEDLFLNSELIKSPYRYDFGVAYDGHCLKGMGLFKIPWASAFTAHVHNGFDSKSFVVTQLTETNDDWRWLIGKQNEPSFIPLFALKPNLAGRRFLFRGQTEEYKIPNTDIPTCKPNAYRPDVEKNPLPHRIKAYEMACLVSRHPLVDKLGVKGVRIFNEPFRFQLNRLGLTQHYYNKSSFLDLTSDIDVAKFFATCDYDSATDSYKPHITDGKLGILYVYDMRLPGEFQSTSLPQLSTIGKQYVFLRSAMQSGFLLNMPPNLNLHDLKNVYRIYFRHNDQISNDVVRNSDYGEKYFPKDALSMHWKDLRNAPNSDFSISIKAREMYVLNHSNEVQSVEQLDELLVKEGFKLGDNLWPEFPDYILQDYQNNAERLWSEFCADINFLGTEGRFMKRALEQIV